MKPAKVILAFFATIVLLFAARESSMRRVPDIGVSTKFQDITLKHSCKHVFKGDLTPAQLDVAVEGGLLPDKSNLELYYRRTINSTSTDSSLQRVESVSVPGSGLVYRVRIPNQGRGTEFSYYWQLEGDSGQLLATVPEPNDSLTAGKVWFRFEGNRSVILLVAHIAGMFGSLLFMILALLTAGEDLKQKKISIRLGKQVGWATFIVFLGSFPIGIWLENQVYGTYWTGFPFGRDITDSKALIVFLVWFTLLFLLKGSAFQGDPKGDKVGAGMARVLTVLATIISLGLYLIPHSSGNF